MAKSKRKPKLEVGQILWILPSKFDVYNPPEPKPHAVTEYDGYYTFKVEGYDCEFETDSMTGFLPSLYKTIYCYKSREAVYEFLDRYGSYLEIQRYFSKKFSALELDVKELNKIIEIINGKK
jgi:hypothetical protein